MPEQQTLERARAAQKQGKAPSTQAGEFVREEVRHIRAGKHGARNSRQAIAIGLSKARRAGVKLPPPAKGRTSEKTRRQARQDSVKGQNPKPPANRKRSQATTPALKREGRSAASRPALARQAKTAARRRTPQSRSTAARKAARTRVLAKAA